MMRELLDELLSDSRAVVERLLEEPLLPPPTLARQLHAWEAAVQRREAPHADLELAASLLRGLRTLLASLDDTAAEREHRLVQVAVRYFVLEDDGDGDLDSPFGFDDDVEVFNAVAERVGRPELAIEA